MSKTELAILASLGIVVLYLLVLIITTAIFVGISTKDNTDDFDYAMTANIIQFFVIVVLIAQKVAQWIN